MISIYDYLYVFYYYILFISIKGYNEKSLMKLKECVRIYFKKHGVSDCESFLVREELLRSKLE